jgi:acyl-CoA synthetase (AMP-forming)/AMP-acid ligase II
MLIIYLRYGELGRLSRDFAAFLQGFSGMAKGERVAIMSPNLLPNLLQYSVALFRVACAPFSINLHSACGYDRLRSATSRRSSSPPNLLNISRSKAPLRALAVPGRTIVLMMNCTMFQLFHTTAGRASLFHCALWTGQFDPCRPQPLRGSNG